jgi:hypothetical protein
MWNAATERPAINSRIVALGYDGAEATMFYVEDAGHYADEDGDVYEFDLEDDFAFWAYLPEDYRLPFEMDETAELVDA